VNSITINGVDDELLTALQTLAAKKNKSINQLVLDLLRKNTTHCYHDLDDLFGSWSENEYQQIKNEMHFDKANSNEKMD